MHPHDQHFLVIGAIEDADPPALRQAAGGAPEKIVLQFLGAGLFEAEDLAALRIDAGHDVPDSAVLAGGVHALENQQAAHSGRMRSEDCCSALSSSICFFQQFSILLLRLAEGLHDRRPLRRVSTFFPGRTRNSFEWIFIFILSHAAARFASGFLR